MAAFGLNAISVIGNLTKDPEHFVTKNDKDGVRFSVASTNIKGTPNFYSVICYGVATKSIMEYLHKGSKVFLTGDLSVVTYDYNDKKGTTLEISTEKVIFLSLKQTDVQLDEAQTTESVDNDDSDDSDMPF